MIDQAFPESNVYKTLTTRNTLPQDIERKLPIHCPQCTQPIQLTKGLCGGRLIDAIMLQAERVGAELHCNQCQHTFVYYHVRTLGQALDGTPDAHRSHTGR